MAHLARLNSHKGLVFLLGAIVFALGTFAFIVFADAPKITPSQSDATAASGTSSGAIATD